MNISTHILGFINAASRSHIPVTHPSSSWYKVGPIIILVGVSDATGDNDYVNSTPVVCIYPLTTFLDFIRINPPGSSLLLNDHLIGTVFLPFAFTALLFIIIHSFLERKFLAS